MNEWIFFIKNLIFGDAFHLTLDTTQYKNKIPFTHVRRICTIVENSQVRKKNIRTNFIRFYISKKIQKFNLSNDSRSNKYPIENWGLEKPELITIPAGNYMFKVNNRNTRTRCEICWKLTIKIPEATGVVLVSFLLTLNIFHTLL